MKDHESDSEFREHSYFQNVPFIHGRYEADQKSCDGNFSMVKLSKTGEMNVQWKSKVESTL